MARQFSDMVTNVGRTVGDTGDTTKTFIKTYLNNRYFDVANRLDWNVFIDNDYTFNSVAGTSEVSLPTGFDSEIALTDITNGSNLVRMTQQEFLQLQASDYASGSRSSGTPERYYISRDDSILTLDPKPSAVITYLMPYKKRVTELSADADTIIINDIEWIMEIGAIADTWSYKRQFQKAAYYESRYEDALQRKIHAEVNQINQIHQAVPATYPERESY
jgi:hypothetical protein